ncbi:hypothetical protein ACKTEK_12085 [Tepidamorphus sp. 3E244]|uniref:hypothetical protein n=1 Tax=Tepidamorphus sp. 3E244 TaxID=3385498 RepID=UPI0038FCD856
MRMLPAIVCVLLASLAGGCATTPKAEVYDVTPTDVLRNIKCELREAYRNNEQLAGDWLSALQLSMKVSNSAGAGGGVSFIVPTNPGTLSIGMSSRLSGYGAKTERIYFTESLSKLNADVYDTICNDALYYQGKRIMLVGKIGFDELFARVRDTIELTNTNVTQLDYNLYFEISMSGSASARISSLPIGSDGFFGADVGADGEKGNNHSLQVTFYPPQPSYCPVPTINGSCPTLVYQVNQQTIQVGRRGRSAASTPAPAPRPVPSRGTAVPSRDELNRALDRNTTNTIVDNLRNNDVLN